MTTCAPASASATAHPRPQTSGDVKSRRIDRVLDYIHAHYTEELRVAELSRIAALSPTAFHRMFLRHTRQTFIEYVKRLRVGTACAEPITNDRPVRLIAEAAGYRSIANFNRQFRDLKGHTPSQYRKMFRQP